MRALLLLPAIALSLSCNGTTGFELVNFYAAARGPSDAVKGQPYTFDLEGQQVSLTKATLHVGALYLTQSVPTSGGGPAPCVLPGTYDGVFVGEVRGGGDVDLLDPSPQPLSVTGEGSTIPAASGQVWLTHGDVNAADPQDVVRLEGSVVAAGERRTFSGGIALNTASGSTSTASNSLLPGESQICLVRIVSGIPVDLTLAQAGTLVLVVDPKKLLENANFATTSSPIELSADQSNQPSTNLYLNLKSTGPYHFEWLPP